MKNKEWHRDPVNGVLFNKDRGMRRDPETDSTCCKREGLFILHLKGDPYQRGKAHGKLLYHEIRSSGIVNYYSDRLIDNLVRNRANPLKRWLIKQFLEKIYYAPLEKRCLDEVKQEIYGVADGAGLDRKKSLRATLTPDLMEHLAAGWLIGGKEALGNYYLGGCSGIYVRNMALKRNQLALFARNMDFYGGDVWKYPAIIFSHPTEKVKVFVKTAAGKFEEHTEIKQPYMYISTAGFSGHGLTGYNAAGIAMATFVNLSKNYTKRGYPTLVFNHLLLTRIKSIEGLKTFIKEKKFTSASPHTVFFADSSEAVSLEADASHNIIIPMYSELDFHIRTNHFINPRMKKKEFEYPLAEENTIGRYIVLKSLLDENFGRIGVQEMINIISSNISLVSQKSALMGDFPAQISTLTSIIFEPGTGNFWVASGNPPAVCYNEYNGFNFYKEIAGQKYRLPTYRRADFLFLNNNKISIKVTAKMKESLKLVIASQEDLNEGNVKGAIVNLEKALVLYSDPGYQYIRGLLYLKDKQPEKALQIIRFVKNNFEFPPVKKSVLLLWEGLCLSAQGLNKEAKKCYKYALKQKGLVRHLKKAFKHYKRKAFSLKDWTANIEYPFLGPLRFY